MKAIVGLVFSLALAACPTSTVRYPDEWFSSRYEVYGRATNDRTCAAPQEWGGGTEGVALFVTRLEVVARGRYAVEPIRLDTPDITQDSVLTLVSAQRRPDDWLVAWSATPDVDLVGLSVHAGWIRRSAMTEADRQILDASCADLPDDALIWPFAWEVERTLPRITTDRACWVRAGYSEGVPTESELPSSCRTREAFEADVARLPAEM